MAGVLGKADEELQLGPGVICWAAEGLVLGAGVLRSSEELLAVLLSLKIFYINGCMCVSLISVSC